jgi:D-3-phosphoglycerate dehydrogenase
VVAVSLRTIEAGDVLKLIIRAGAGTNTIDTRAASGRHVYVCNVPGKNAIAVAELAMGLLLSIDRRIPDNVQDLRRGRWDKRRYSQARGLYGRRVGIVGLGATGLAFAERARAFGLSISAVRNPRRSAEVLDRLTALDVRYVDDLLALAAACDILSFHVPASADTKGMVGREFLAAARPGAVLINTSRGDIVDEGALLEAMDAKGIRVGLDVYVNEPGGDQGRFDSALARHPNVYGTHHIGASTDQAQDAVAEGVVEIIECFVAGKVLHCVNATI